MRYAGQHPRAPPAPHGKGAVPGRHRPGGGPRARVRAEPLAARADPVRRRGPGAAGPGGGGGGDGGGSRRHRRAHPHGDGDERCNPLPSHRLAPRRARHGALRGGNRGGGRREQSVRRRGCGGPRRGRLRAAPGGRGRAPGVRRRRPPRPRARAGQRALSHRVVIRGRGGAGAVRAGADPGPIHLPAPPRLGNAHGRLRRNRILRPDQGHPRGLLVDTGAPHPPGRSRPLPGGGGEPDPGRRPRRRRRLRPQDAAPARGSGDGRDRRALRKSRQVGAGPDGAPPGGLPFARHHRRSASRGACRRAHRGPQGAGVERRRRVLLVPARLFPRPADGRGGAPGAVPGSLVPLHRPRRRDQQVPDRGISRASDSPWVPSWPRPS